MTITKQKVKSKKLLITNIVVVTILVIVSASIVASSMMSIGFWYPWENPNNGVEIKSRMLTLTDVQTNTPLNIGVWHPRQAAGQLPIIIFSHGLTSCAQQSQTLFKQLAQNGYVIISVDHTRTEAAKLCLTQNTSDLSSYALNVNWEEGEILERFMPVLTMNKEQPIPFPDRSKEIAIAIDDITINDKSIIKSYLTNNNIFIDTNNIGVIGYSLGGPTMIDIAGMATPGNINNRGQYVKAMLLMDPTIIRSKIKVPLMILAGRTDVGEIQPLRTQRSEMREYYFQEATKNKYLIYFKEVGHLTFAEKMVCGIAGINKLPNCKDIDKKINKIDSYTVNFFNKYLKRDTNVNLIKMMRQDCFPVANANDWNNNKDKNCYKSLFDGIVGGYDFVE